MSKSAKQHHPFDKGLGRNTNILLIVIPFVTYCYMCKLNIFATPKIHAALAKSDSHCLASFRSRANCFIKLVIIWHQKNAHHSVNTFMQSFGNSTQFSRLKTNTVHLNYNKQSR